MTRGARRSRISRARAHRANIWEKPTRGKPVRASSDDRGNGTRIPHAPGEAVTRPSGSTIAAFVCAALIGLLYVSPVLEGRGADRARLADLDRPPGGPDPHQLRQVVGAAAAPLPRRRQLRRVPDLLPEPLGLADQRRRRSAGLSRHDRAGGPLRPAAGLRVPAAQLPVDRGRRRRPPRGARREPAHLPRRQLVLLRPTRPRLRPAAQQRAPRAVPRDLARDGAEPGLGAAAALPEPHAPRLPRLQSNARGLRRSPARRRCSTPTR